MTLKLNCGVFRRTKKQTLKEILKEMTASVDRLTASVAALTVAVDAELNKPDESAAIDAASDVVDAETAKLTAATVG